LKDFLNRFGAHVVRLNTKNENMMVPGGDQGHEMPVHGEIHTISEGFSGGGCTASQRKKYV